MSIGDWIILGVLAVLVFFAVRYAIRRRGSCGSCKNCTKNCAMRKPTAEEK